MIHTLYWVKSTSPDNLPKTRGHYLQHCKEALLIARRRNIRPEETSYGPRDTLSPDFIQERQVLAGAKPQSVLFLLESWFDKSTVKVKWFARHNNLRPGWISLGNELSETGLHAVIVPYSDIPIK